MLKRCHSVIHLPTDFEDDGCGMGRELVNLSLYVIAQLAIINTTAKQLLKTIFHKHICWAFDKVKVLLSIGTTMVFIGWFSHFDTELNIF